MTSRWKETFWPPASQLYSPASALPACCTTSRRPWPMASTRTFELELSFLPSLYHVTSVWAWATSQLSVALVPATACTLLRAGCSLANTTEGSGDRGIHRVRDPTSGRQPRAEKGGSRGGGLYGSRGAESISGLCTSPLLCRGPLRSQQQSHIYASSSESMGAGPAGRVATGKDVSRAHGICRVTRHVSPNLARWCPSCLHVVMQELFACGPWRGLRLGALPTVNYCQLAHTILGACLPPFPGFLCHRVIKKLSSFPLSTGFTMPIFFFMVTQFKSFAHLQIGGFFHSTLATLYTITYQRVTHT